MKLDQAEKTFQDIACGTYTLLIFVPAEKRVQIGKLGNFKFVEGYYAYTGSAIGKGSASLARRVQRHLRKEKKMKWHIDYLFNRGDTRIEEIMVGDAPTRMECQINQSIRDKMCARILVKGFGSSDCAQNCRSHLLYLGKSSEQGQHIVRLYNEIVGADVYRFML